MFTVDGRGFRVDCSVGLILTMGIGARTAGNATRGVAIGAMAWVLARTVASTACRKGNQGLLTVMT